mmetsp:Transcript_65645/g.161624  ORF Transcript_65645/g.161624 Transcript_65645/m.161624 type:complete len:204 (-) Transcript_65645:93-704(-)
MMERMSFSKPRSSMRSASSSTRYDTLDTLQTFSCIRSSRRPGVATSTCTPFLSAARCSCLGTPPNTHTVETPMGCPAFSSTVALCIASSLVGATTSMTGVLLFVSPSLLMCVNPGSPNARVFPDPVSAMPTRSLPLRQTGQHCAWMAVGLANPLHASMSFGSKGASEKLMIGWKSQRSTLTSFSSRHLSAPFSPATLTASASS